MTDRIPIRFLDPSGATSGQVPVYNSTTSRWEPGTISGGGSGALLAYVNYFPGSASSYTTTSTTIVDVDATNLAITFTAPSSGRVLVRLTGLCNTGSAVNNIAWGLRESTTTVAKRWLYAPAGKNILMTASFVVTGLTSGSNHTYKWGHYVNNSATTSSIAVGPDAFADFPALMEVHALP